MDNVVEKLILAYLAILCGFALLGTSDMGAAYIYDAVNYLQCLGVYF